MHKISIFGGDILMALYDITAYDSEGQNLGKINGGTGDHTIDERWTSENALAFVNDQEIPLTSIFFNEDEMNHRINELERQIIEAKDILNEQTHIAMMETYANDIVSLYKRRELLITYTEDKMINIDTRS